MNRADRYARRMWAWWYATFAAALAQGVLVASGWGPLFEIIGHPWWLCLVVACYWRGRRDEAIRRAERHKCDYARPSDSTERTR